MAELTRFDVIVILNTGKNFAGVDLSGLELGGLDFSGANLRGATISGADLRGINFTNADLTGANLAYSDLSGAKLGGAILDYTLLRGTRMADADFGVLEMDDELDLSFDLDWFDFDEAETETYIGGDFMLESADFMIEAA